MYTSLLAIHAKGCRRDAARHPETTPISSSALVALTASCFSMLFTQTSNRKVPATELGGLDGDLPARTFVDAQDREIGVVSGRPRGRIKSISRSPKTLN